MTQNGEGMGGGGGGGEEESVLSFAVQIYGERGKNGEKKEVNPTLEKEESFQLER